MFSIPARQLSELHSELTQSPPELAASETRYLSLNYRLGSSKAFRPSLIPNKVGLTIVVIGHVRLESSCVQSTNDPNLLVGTQASPRSRLSTLEQALISLRDMRKMLRLSNTIRWVLPVVWLGLLFYGEAGDAQQSKLAQTLKKLNIDLRVDSLQAVLTADGAMEHRVYLIEDSRQLVLDILNVRNPLKGQRPKDPHAFLERMQSQELAMTAYDRSASMGQTFARLIFDLKQPATYAIRAETGRIELALRPKDSEDPTTVAGESSETSESNEGSSVESATDPALPANYQIEPEGVDPSLFFGASQGGSGEYHIGPEDVLELGVFELDQLNRTVRVESDGSVILPLIGPVNVRGLTARQAADRVAGRLRNGFVDDPQVTVLIKEYHSRKVSLLGAVSRPAAYPLVGQRNLLQLLTEAGGLSAEAGGVLYIFRQLPGGKNARLTVPLNELLIQGDPRWNIGLRPGDVVSIPPEEAISVSVVGAVNSPGVYKLPVGQGATLLRVIALSGGLKGRASKDLQIKRYTSSGEETILKVDLGDILSGKSPDVVLLEGDVVVVKQSFF